MYVFRNLIRFLTGQIVPGVLIGMGIGFILERIIDKKNNELFSMIYWQTILLIVLLIVGCDYVCY